MLVSRLARASAFMWVSLVAGCAGLLQQSSAERQFRMDYACSQTEVAEEPGGYAVKGCGTVAHYRCFSLDNHEPFKPDDDACVLAEEQSTELVAQTRSPVEVTVRASETLGVVVRGHAPLPGAGRLLALGAPLKEPRRVVLELHTLQRVPPGTCAARLFGNGAPLEVSQASAVGDYDVRLIVDVSVLDAMQSSARLAGDACGVSFEIDDLGREMLTSFELRFREEISRARDQRRVADAGAMPAAP
jgi:hypothetical protein